MKKVLYTICTLFLIFLNSCTDEKSKQPNVIYIYPDQYRTHSLGFWSEGDNAKNLQGKPDPVSTPELDKLANEGIVFTRAVSNFPLCSPYRGMFLSGRYPNNNGIHNNCRKDREESLRQDIKCVTDVFSEANYNVAYFGKCHWVKNVPVFTKEGKYVGTTNEPGGHRINSYDTYVPPGADRHSIDYFYQVMSHGHYNPDIYSNDSIIIDGKADGEPHSGIKFNAELEADAIIDYIKNTHQQRNSEKPFFIMWSLNPPHNPWAEKDTYMEFYPQYTENGKVKLDKLLTHENADSTVGDYAAYYFANVSAVDYFIGKVLKQLQAQGLEENTIIAFTSDHGEMLGSHGLTGKNVPQFESFSIPFILKWKNKIQHRIDDLILSVPDVMPTLLGLAGLEEQIPDGVQGVNYAPLMLNENSTEVNKPKAALFINTPSRGIYTGKYMLVVSEKDGKLDEAYCYDNEADPYQLNKLPLNEVESSDELLKDLAQLLKDTNDRWYVNKTCSDILKY